MLKLEREPGGVALLLLSTGGNRASPEDANKLEHKREPVSADRRSSVDGSDHAPPLHRHLILEHERESESWSVAFGNAPDNCTGTTTRATTSWRADAVVDVDVVENAHRQQLAMINDYSMRVFL